MQTSLRLGQAPRNITIGKLSKRRAHIRRLGVHRGCGGRMDAGRPADLSCPRADHQERPVHVRRLPEPAVPRECQVVRHGQTAHGVQGERAAAVGGALCSRMSITKLRVCVRAAAASGGAPYALPGRQQPPRATAQQARGHAHQGRQARQAPSAPRQGPSGQEVKGACTPRSGAPACAASNTVGGGAAPLRRRLSASSAF